MWTLHWKALITYFRKEVKPFEFQVAHVTFVHIVHTTIPPFLGMMTNLYRFFLGFSFSFACSKTIAHCKAWEGHRYRLQHLCYCILLFTLPLCPITKYVSYDSNKFRTRPQDTFGRVNLVKEKQKQTSGNCCSTFAVCVLCDQTITLISSSPDWPEANAGGNWFSNPAFL